MKAKQCVRRYCSEPAQIRGMFCSVRHMDDWQHSYLIQGVTVRCACGCGNRVRVASHATDAFATDECIEVWVERWRGGNER